MRTNFYSDLDFIINEFFNQTTTPTKYRFASDSGFPKINILSKKIDDKEALVIEAGVAGYKSKDISVKIDKNVLIISGSQEKDVEGSARYFLNELKASTFERRILLSDRLDLDNVSVIQENGILTITFFEDQKKLPKTLLIEEK